MRKLVASYIARWRQRNVSSWDSPVTGNDLLAAMIKAKTRKENPLP